MCSDQKLELKQEYEWHECGDKDTTDNMLVITAFWDSKYIGFGEFILKHNRLLPNNIEIDPKFQRRGIATAIYVLAERTTGLTTRPHNQQTEAGRAFWAQKRRPFGYGCSAE